MSGKYLLTTLILTRPSQVSPLDARELAAMLRARQARLQSLRGGLLLLAEREQALKTRKNAG